jgi:hypothetical protein
MYVCSGDLNEKQLEFFSAENSQPRVVKRES